MLSIDSTYTKVHDVRRDVDAVATGLQSSWYSQYGKRLFDITVASLVTLFVLSWLLPIVCLIIRITSPGPGLFRQVRSGRRGQVFRCLKFRTMYYNPKGNFAQCRQHDSRVTPIGRFLRRTNLDEMPQFLNVLWGDMSIVGPRPHAIQHDEMYWTRIPSYHKRYLVRPGITGLAQVRGARGETRELINMKHRVDYDLLYVRRESLGLDVKLCLATVKAMVKGNVNAW
ncbi:sugar transferase [Rudanella paleaurantiibacter]|uniref:sugar transferase n=1 Tax=Rudanella paleaurantiibacter TaxID=2614655 RepID=UPI001FE99AC2|nr:sugar transferase [Rudanella paleaurantiibacter]